MLDIIFISYNLILYTGGQFSFVYDFVYTVVIIFNDKKKIVCHFEGCLIYSRNRLHMEYFILYITYKVLFDISINEEGWYLIKLILNPFLPFDVFIRVIL